MIKAVIFDLGGVILNISYGRTIEQLSKLSRTNFADIYTQQRQTSLFDEFETGKIKVQEFRYRLKSLLQTDIADQALDEAWNAMLLDIPSSRIEFLEQVAARKRIFLLSNTNAIHKRAFDRIVQTSLGDRLSDFSQIFEKAYYSHLVGDRKPNASIFERVLTENHLDPHQTLFIDDTLGHIEGAEHVGLQALHLTSGQTIEDLDMLHS